MKQLCFCIGGVSIYNENYDFALEGWTSMSLTICFSMQNGQHFHGFAPLLYIIIGENIEFQHLPYIIIGNSMGSWVHHPGSQGAGSCDQDPGSTVLGPGSCVQDRGSRMPVYLQGACMPLGCLSVGVMGSYRITYDYVKEWLKFQIFTYDYVKEWCKSVEMLFVLH